MRRALNEIEYFNWCFGQPYNMVVVVRLRGELRPERLEVALAAAQRRHPLLSVNTELGADGLPWFDSAGVGAIPLAVIDAAGPEDARRLAERELTATFAMDRTGPDRLPLLRASLFRARGAEGSADLVFTVQHVIADGLSMVYLVRDLLRLMEQPGAPLEVLDAPASPDDLLPARVRRKLATSPFRFKVALWLARAWVRLRFGGETPPPRSLAHHHRSWALTPEQSERLRARCRAEGVSVQSAICAAFLPGFVHVHTPVNLRPLLARPVGESLGLYVGAAEVQLEYRAARGFWENARRFHRRLRRAQRNPFRIFQLFSRAVPVGLVRQLGPLLVRMMSRERPFAVTNLGTLDEGGLQLRSRDLAVESFFGAVTAIVDSSVLTVYTLGGSLRLELLATEAGPAETAIRDEAERAVGRLREAIGS